MFFSLAVDQKQLDRAKASTKSAVLMNLESRVCPHPPLPLGDLQTFCIVQLLISWCIILILQMVASEDIGRQILTYGERFISFCLALNIFSNSVRLVRHSNSSWEQHIFNIWFIIVVHFCGQLHTWIKVLQVSLVCLPVSFTRLYLTLLYGSYGYKNHWGGNLGWNYLWSNKVLGGM